MLRKSIIIICCRLRLRVLIPIQCMGIWTLSFQSSYKRHLYWNNGSTSPWLTINSEIEILLKVLLAVMRIQNLHLPPCLKCEEWNYFISKNFELEGNPNFNSMGPTIFGLHINQFDIRFNFKNIVERLGGKLYMR